MSVTRKGLLHVFIFLYNEKVIVLQRGGCIKQSCIGGFWIFLSGEQRRDENEIQEDQRTL
ncbi:hypothetical protein SANA_12500 [Gottschalkiaceae bacterium SANA]|nr:hypothetical protein SANA_12500 [Gottschalkiaceae bacterium SANA]